MAVINYADAGVHRQLADQFVEKIGLLSKSTLNRRVKAAVGGYASLYELDKKRCIAASTDGVGTKLKIAFELGVHHTVGIDLVAMSVNDLLCVGAEPLFFLDYLATGRLNPAVAEQVLAGIVEGCKQAQCALVGGETAEMPDFYNSGEYDLAGFAVGLVNASQALPVGSFKTVRKNRGQASKRKSPEIQPGDVLIGIASSGVHSNGFSLFRKLVPSQETHPEQRQSKLRELLTPTKIYVKCILPLLEKKLLKGLAHITGSGYLNVPRISERVSYEIQLPRASERPPIFSWVQERSGLSFSELSQTVNLGVGMVLAVSSRKSAEVFKMLKKSGEKAWILGEVTRSNSKKGPQVFLSDGDQSTVLDYI